MNQNVLQTDLSGNITNISAMNANTLLTRIPAYSGAKTAGFITGVVIPVDGGFSAYSGV